MTMIDLEIGENVVNYKKQEEGKKFNEKCHVC